MSIICDNNFPEKIEIIFNDKKKFSWERFLKESPKTPFFSDATALCEGLSRRLLTEQRCVAYPDLVALGFWFRSARLKKIQSNFVLDKDIAAVGRGIVFHLAPSNVDTIFAYSLLLSLLAGNCNIVRLGQKQTSQQNLLLKLLSEEMLNFPELARRNLIVRYPHEDQITAFFSASCHLRMIWGGDATINHIRKIPIPAGSAELTFSGKFSLAVIDAEQWMQNSTQKKSVSAFLNDAFSFGQQSCSSPKLICWVGNKNLVHEAQDSFWMTVDAMLSQTQNPLSASESMRRWLAVNATAMEADSPVKLISSTDKSSYFRLQLEGWQDLKREIHIGSGIFYELCCDKLTDVLRNNSDQDQTIVTFGFDETAWRKALQDQPPRGVCRIVPMGKALEFSSVWDGVDLIGALSRKIILWS